MQVKTKSSITEIEFPAVITPVKDFPVFERNLINIGKYKIPILEEVIKSFSLTFLDLPPTVVVLNSFVDLVLYATKHKLYGWLIDKNYDFYKLPFGISGVLTTFEIEKEQQGYIKCKNAPYLLLTPYANLENYKYAVTLFYEHFYFCVGYSPTVIHKQIITM